MKTLVIDDEESLRLVIRTFLEREGWEVVECATAEEGMQAYAQESFPLIMLDLYLPGMTGFEFCRWLRARPEGDRPYVVACTSSQRAQDLQMILEIGANDYIAKPYDANLLRIRLQVAAQHLRNMQARKRLEAELRAEREQLSFLASHDPLTRLGNRAALTLRLEQAVEAARQGVPGALVYLDLDNFKVVNDTAGHAAGDRLLMHIGFLLKSAIRSEDQAFRFGGDEFVLILPGASVAEAALVAERIRAALEEFSFVEDGRTFRAGASIGVAGIDGLLGPEQIMAFADAACYRAKARGRNRVAIHQPGDDDIARLRHDTDWAGRIKEALRNGHFTLVYQPIVDLQTRTPIFHEVLLRLEGADETLIPPATFLPPAERFRLMPQIDRYVIEHALEELQRDPDLVVSINLSGQSFADPDLATFIEGTFADGVAPARVIFEITETAAISNLPATRALVERLRERGFRFALDDFGAGFSSFSYLKTLKCDFLKIDGSFVRDTAVDPTNWTFVRLMNELAHSLGVRSVAESVENEGIATKLQELGIDFAQGYFFGRPARRSRPEG